MAGYSATPLVTKLGIKDEHTVLLDGLPGGLDLGDLGAAHVVRRLPARAVLDVTVVAIDEVWSGLKLVRRLADR